jgi:NADPH:quinone reductase-like Zn-dependent oxidoreductase
MSERFTTEAGAITPQLATAKSRAAGRKSIFVTGAARGIGRATCELFAAAGWYVTARDWALACFYTGSTRTTLGTVD